MTAPALGCKKTENQSNVNLILPVGKTNGASKEYYSIYSTCFCHHFCFELKSLGCLGMSAWELGLHGGEVLRPSKIRTKPEKHEIS